jgi:ferredoxin-NADP reductase
MEGLLMAYSSKLLERTKLAGDVAVVRLEKPEGFEFIAGQWCFMGLPDLGFQDERGLRRPFSIASSPLDKELFFATKLSNSAMKRTLAEMPLGSVISLEKPLGNFILPEDTSTPLAFLAGGMGITPFRSMLRYAADARTGHTITLFYSSRTPGETPFLDELMTLSDRNPGIALAITMTRAEADSNWSGLTGRLSPDMIRNACKDWENAAYYVVGPPIMAEAMKQTLSDMNIASERIKVELFAGY